MVIPDILAQLETATHPVAKALHKGSSFRVLVIGFKDGMVLAEHKAHLPSRLTVLSGSVVYKQGDEAVTLNRYDEHEIPVDITHSVTALADSLCLLTQG
jgi:quercetin dioxygenase-like cupin family protein